MSQDKTNQIDDLLNQLDQKDENNKKKKIFLFIGLLILGLAAVFALKSFIGNNDTGTAMVTNDLNSNINNSPEINTVIVPTNVNNDDINEEDLEEDVEDDDVEEEDVPAKVSEEEPKKTEVKDKEKNKKETAKAKASEEEENTTGVSNRVFSADELADIPAAKVFNPDKTVKPKEASKPENNDKVKKPKEEKVVEEKKSEIVEEEAPEPVKEEKPEIVEEEAPVATKPAVKTGVSKEPSYPGGEKKMRQFFARKISYPSKAINNKVEGNVIVRIKVDEQGKIIDSQVVKGIGSGCDKEVLKAISKMPTWEPGLENGQPVEKFYLLSVSFKLPK